MTIVVLIVIVNRQNSRNYYQDDTKFVEDLVHEQHQEQEAQPNQHQHQNYNHHRQHQRQQQRQYQRQHHRQQRPTNQPTRVDINSKLRSCEGSFVHLCDAREHDTHV